MRVVLGGFRIQELQTTAQAGVYLEYKGFKNVAVNIGKLTLIKHQSVVTKSVKCPDRPFTRVNDHN